MLPAPIVMPEKWIVTYICQGEKMSSWSGQFFYWLLCTHVWYKEPLSILRILSAPILWEMSSWLLEGFQCLMQSSKLPVSQQTVFPADSQNNLYSRLLKTIFHSRFLKQSFATDFWKQSDHIPFLDFFLSHVVWADRIAQTAVVTGIQESHFHCLKRISETISNKMFEPQALPWCSLGKTTKSRLIHPTISATRPWATTQESKWCPWTANLRISNAKNAHYRCTDSSHCMLQAVLHHNTIINWWQSSNEDPIHLQIEHHQTAAADVFKNCFRV